MSDALFDMPTSYARLSEDGVYRYTLGRRWSDPHAPAAVFVMLNPSAADAEQDDPTIRRCIGFAEDLGMGGLHVVNLYAWRATEPAALWDADAASHDIVGPDNDDVLRETFRDAAREDRPVIAAWGAGGRPDRVEFVSVLAKAAGCPLLALGLTMHGAPRHPLYVPAVTRPITWAVA